MSKSTNRRKSIAIALAVLGVAGLSLASAAQLNLTGTASVQSGMLALNADCQSTPITVSFSAPVRTGATYSSASVILTGIDTTAGKCLGKSYKLALLDGATTPGLIGTEFTGIIAAGDSTMTKTIPTVAGVSQDTNIKTVALSIYS
ncbi:hypothetical protein BH11ACT1_BH11ACT1_16070 [soil metagenome]